MPTTREIKRRMRGISNTRQITKAMELVSTTKLRKARLKLDKTRPYYTTVVENIRSVMEFVNENHRYLKNREVKNSLYIVMTSDRGLAGGYNNNILHKVEKMIESDPEAHPLIVTGSKAEDFFDKHQGHIVKAFKGLPEVIEFNHASQIAEVAMELYERGEVDEVNLVFTRFDSTLKYTPLVMKILPFNRDKCAIGGGTRSVRRFEPSPDEVLDLLIPQYVKVMIYGALIEASASEQASRRSAMEAATENADEMLDELSMSFNRARQAGITSEITEIVSGADALK